MARINFPVVRNVRKYIFYSGLYLGGRWQSDVEVSGEKSREKTSLVPIRRSDKVDKRRHGTKLFFYYFYVSFLEFFLKVEYWKNCEVALHGRRRLALRVDVIGEILSVSHQEGDYDNYLQLSLLE